MTPRGKSRLPRLTDAPTLSAPSPRGQSRLPRLTDAPTLSATPPRGKFRRPLPVVLTLVLALCLSACGVGHARPADIAAQVVKELSLSGQLLTDLGPAEAYTRAAALYPLVRDCEGWAVFLPYDRSGCEFAVFLLDREVPAELPFPADSLVTVEGRYVLCELHTDTATPAALPLLYTDD